MTEGLLKRIAPYAAVALMGAGLLGAGIRAFNRETPYQAKPILYTQTSDQRLYDLMKDAEKPRTWSTPSVYTHKAENLREINNRKVR